jgi:hypothetical protein
MEFVIYSLKVHFCLYGRLSGIFPEPAEPTSLIQNLTSLKSVLLLSCHLSKVFRRGPFGFYKKLSYISQFACTKVTVWWLAFLLHVQEVLGLILV